MRLSAIADELSIVRLRVEDEDRAHFLIGDIDKAFGVDRDAVGPDELEGKCLGVELFILRLAAGETVHPRCLGLLTGGRRVINFRPCKVVEPVHACDAGRGWPHKLGRVEGELARPRVRRSGSVALFLFAGVPSEGHCHGHQRQQGHGKRLARRSRVEEEAVHLSLPLSRGSR